MEATENVNNDNDVNETAEEHDDEPKKKRRRLNSNSKSKTTQSRKTKKTSKSKNGSSNETDITEVKEESDNDIDNENENENENDNSDIDIDVSMITEKKDFESDINDDDMLNSESKFIGNISEDEWEDIVDYLQRFVDKYHNQSLIDKIPLGKQHFSQKIQTETELSWLMVLKKIEQLSEKSALKQVCLIVYLNVCLSQLYFCFVPIFSVLFFCVFVCLDIDALIL